jgi:predicted DNA-binding transcriptional regulator AlpA
MKAKATIEPATTYRAPPQGTSILGMDIKDAAAAVGLSRAQFYRLYLKSGRVKAQKTGGRDRVIDYAELKAAYEKLRDELPRVESLA